MTEDVKQTDRLTVLMAEDDPDDRFLIEQAFTESRVSGTLRFVEDGQELMDYLFRRVQHEGISESPRPSCVLLDLNMPRKDGREALWEIRQDPGLSNLPVIVLTTSNSEKDKEYCTELGVSDYVTKPSSFTELIDLVKKIEALSLL